MDKIFIARFRKIDKKDQLLKKHLRGVQSYAEKIGERIQIPHITGLAAILHDLGKYSDAFQEYIEQAKLSDENQPKIGSVDHSSAGGLLLFERYYQSTSSVNISKILIESVSNAIFSHHDQLKDMLQRGEDSPFWNRRHKKIDEGDYERAKERFFTEIMTCEELDEYVLRAEQEYQKLVKKAEHLQMKYNSVNRIYWLHTLLTKYIFSTLLEADRTNSRMFENDEEDINQDIDQDNQLLFREHQSKLENYISKFKKDTKINELRAAMSQNCFDFATNAPGIYTLSIPTGGGKTLAGMRFALRHALKYEKKRIFYFAPFTTVIEQNVDAVEKAIGKNQILEHHSNVIQDATIKDINGEKEDIEEIKLLKETWQAPVIFSTLVQFLNVFYTGRARDSRKLHTLANSVIIFDEVQAVPIQCISLFNEALNFLAHFMNTTIILCTATQPALQYVKRNLIEVKGEIIEDLPMIAQAFKRTNIISLVRPGGWDTNELADLIEEKMENLNSILIILNTKKAVRDLYEKLKDMPDYFVTHLSTSMCAANRANQLEILFKNTATKKICISTQVIEAGVDISFECVIRSLAGLDSIAQAAGRCNRNGENPLGDVYIINHREENLQHLKTIEKGAEIVDAPILKFFDHKPELLGGDLLSSMALEVYFKQYYLNMSQYLDFPIDGNDLNHMLFTNNEKYENAFEGEVPFEMRASFATAGRHFEAIDSKTTAVLVPYKAGRDLIVQLESQEPIEDVGEFLRQAQRYIVNVNSNDLKKLMQNDLLRVAEFKNTKLYVAKENAYSEKYGMDYEGDAELRQMFM